MVVVAVSPPDPSVSSGKATAAVMSLHRGKHEAFSLKKSSNAGGEPCVRSKQEFEQLFKIDVFLETTEGKGIWLQFRKAQKCIPQFSCIQHPVEHLPGIKTQAPEMALLCPSASRGRAQEWEGAEQA